MNHRFSRIFLVLSMWAFGGVAWADEPAGPIAADEPLASEYSLAAAARYLDSAAIEWRNTHACSACHTMVSYMMGRRALNSVVATPPDVRAFFEDAAEGRLDPMPGYSCGDLGASVQITVAASLALDDRLATGKLSPAARRALDAMWKLQRADGGFDWPFRDTPPLKVREHYAATLAAIATGMAPDDYALAEPARAGLAALGRYFETLPPESLHEDAMLAWASAYVPALLSDQSRQQTIDKLLAAQRPDGGWSLASLIENPSAPQTTVGAALRAELGHGETFLVYAGHDASYKSSLASDGYATGLAIYITRQCGTPASDSRIQRGVTWLKADQRASGRWFTPSQAWHSQNLIANAGTVYAVLALSVCEN